MADMTGIPDFAYEGQQLRRAQLAYTRILQELRDCKAQGALEILADLLAESDEPELTEVIDVPAPAPKTAKRSTSKGGSGS
jgi:hypothetical protein